MREVKEKVDVGEKEEELPDDLDEFDAVDIYNQICEQRRKRGYVDYSELRV